MTVNADLEPKTHHQTPMTCTYGFSHFRHFQNCCNRDGNTIFKYMNYVPIVVATDLEVHFSVLKKGVSQYFCLYSVCTSHWCLVVSFGSRSVFTAGANWDILSGREISHASRPSHTPTTNLKPRTTIFFVWPSSSSSHKSLNP